MNTALPLLATLLLAPLAVRAAAPPSPLRYTFETPGTNWTAVSFDDSGWKTAASPAEVASALAATPHRAAWVRWSRALTWQEINHSYFRVKHTGPFELHVNGTLKISRAGQAPEGADYELLRQRADVVGTNLYAVSFRHDGPGTPGLDWEQVLPPWVPVEVRRVKSKPILPDIIRDAQICRGPDDTYYLTGTTGDEVFFKPGHDLWLRNPGIQVFRSRDLTHWTSLGYVWQFERDGTWNRDIGTFCGRGPARGIFAPEIHWLKDRFWLAYSGNHKTDTHVFGISLLRATNAAGPWEELSPSKPMMDGFDANLFQDDDGTVYLLHEGGTIAPMKPDMTGFAGPRTQLKVANFPRPGFEGVYLFKYRGKYVLTAAEWNRHADGRESYDCMAATADHVMGPYGPRHLVMRHGGHNGFFFDRDGQLRATVWTLPDSDHRVTIVRLEMTPDGILRPVAEDCQ